MEYLLSDAYTTVLISQAGLPGGAAHKKQAHRYTGTLINVSLNELFSSFFINSSSFVLSYKGEAVA